MSPSIDASGECSHICQYVNDNHNGNSVMKLRVINKVARLCLFAKKDINYGEEILYDYGDKQSLWWRKKVIFHFIYFFTLSQIWQAQIVS
jgi:hypothetical protein